MIAHLYTPYILGYGTASLSGGKAGWTLYECVDCGNKYKHKGSLQRHIKYECRKQPSFKCPYCVYRAYQKHNLLLHERHLHKDLPEKLHDRRITRATYLTFKKEFLEAEESGYQQQVTISDTDFMKSVMHNMMPALKMQIYDSMYQCEKCNRKYRHKSTYRRHVTYECGKEPKFRCPFFDCTYKAYQKTHTDAHVKTKHRLMMVEYKG
ncbi:unnamed protein product [Pieris macdunnoughi]|uniref:C2H2-type domain-containing protein n=1 Tax=Pieris macdunnoughi TaxID=345717 RepID=A0A821SZI5_9NEOP|nr:unnamed protein product [Pieris macdunnoughi]